MFFKELNKQTALASTRSWQLWQDLGASIIYHGFHAVPIFMLYLYLCASYLTRDMTVVLFRNKERFKYEHSTWLPFNVLWITTDCTTSCYLLLLESIEIQYSLIPFQCRYLGALLPFRAIVHMKALLRSNYSTIYAFGK
jgi:hypothetical protein